MSAIVSIVFDDNHPSIYTEGFARMQPLGLLGVNACITGTVGNTGLYTLAQITEMYNAGWDIVNHTRNHIQMTTQIDSDIIADVSAGRTYLLAQGFTRSANILIAPSNETNEYILNLISPYATMATWRIDNGKDTNNEVPFDLMRVRRRGVANNPPSVIKDWIDEAILNDQHLHLNFHKITTAGTALDYPPTDFQTVIEYIAAKQARGELEVLTMSQLYNRFSGKKQRGSKSIPHLARASSMALSFDGAGDVVNIANSASLAFSGVQPITIAVRHKPGTYGTARMVSQGTEIILRMNGTTREYEFILNSFTTNDRVIAGGFVTAKWQTVVGVYDGTDLMIYVDGKMVERTTPTGAYVNVGTTWKIGQDATEQYTGIMKEVRIFNRAWSAREVMVWTRQGIIDTTGQKGAWFMNEGTGNSVADSSGNGNTGTIVGATWAAQTIGAARSLVSNRYRLKDYGPSLALNGSTSEIVIPTNISLTGPFTISWWEAIRDRSTLRMIFGEGSTNTAKIGHSGSKWFVRVVNGGSSDNTISLPFAGVWTHVMLTRDSNNKVDLIINGVATRLFSDAAQVGTFTINRIGSSQGSSRYTGYLDKIRIFNTYLSTVQRAALQYGDDIPENAGLLLNYELNEGSGTTANDSSGNANHGTITGGTYSTTMVVNKLRSQI